MCLKYGDKGHFARDCRNATLCFHYHCWGHKSFQCKQPHHTLHTSAHLAHKVYDLPLHPNLIVDREFPTPNKDSAMVTPPI
jgi:hypothetical protein